MTTPFLCVFFVFVLAHALKLPVVVAMAREPRGYDNKRPRAQQRRLRGWGARARDAHYNTLECLPAFAAGVVIAHLAGLDDHRASVLAITFVIVRILYPVLYVANLDYLRTGVWLVGWLANAGFFILPWVAS